MNIEALKNELLNKYEKYGDLNLYEFLIVQSIERLDKIKKESKISSSMPNIDLLLYHDQFMILYRREGNQAYLNIAKIFRRAAHTVYRFMLKNNLTPKNIKFLNIV